MVGMLFTTADLCDDHGDVVQVAEPLFADYGFRKAFFGQVTTVAAPRDNGLIAEAIEETGLGRVLVVEGDGALDCALLGDRLAFLAYKHNWSGVVINGCVRDAGELESIDIGIKALGTCPRRSTRSGGGQRDVPVTFAGVEFRPDEWLYADEDGILVAPDRLV